MTSLAGPGGRLGVDDYRRAYEAVCAFAASPTTTPILTKTEEDFLVGAQQYAFVRLLSYRMHGEQGWVLSDIARDGETDWVELAQQWEVVLERFLDGDGETAIGSDSESEGDVSETPSGPEYMLDELAACRASRSFALLESVMQEYDTDAWNARFPGFAALLLSTSMSSLPPVPSLPPFAQWDPAEPDVDATSDSDDSTGPSDQAAPPSATAPQPGHVILSPEPISPAASISIAMLSAHYPASPRPLSRVPSTLADTPVKTTSPDSNERATGAQAASPSADSVYCGDTPPLTPEKPFHAGRGRTGTQSSVETKVGSPEMILAKYMSAASVKSTEDDRRILLWKWMHGAHDPVETPQFELPVMNTASFAQMS